MLNRRVHQKGFSHGSPTSCHWVEFTGTKPRPTAAPSSKLRPRGHVPDCRLRSRIPPKPQTPQAPKNNPKYPKYRRIPSHTPITPSSRVPKPKLSNFPHVCAGMCMRELMFGQASLQSLEVCSNSTKPTSRPAPVVRDPVQWCNVVFIRVRARSQEDRRHPSEVVAPNDKWHRFSMATQGVSLYAVLVRNILYDES